jgi:hypothetical protein
MDLSSMSDNERRKALWEALGMNGMPMPQPAQPEQPRGPVWCLSCFQQFLESDTCPHCGAEYGEE